MPVLLAIDCSTPACSVALLNNGSLTEDYILAPQSHTQRLLPMIDSLLAAAELQLPQLDAIAFTAGPGSFTGLRIGFGVVQGLAYGADLPVIPVSSLQTMAASAVRLLNLVAPVTILPMLDARMNEYYWALYSLSTMAAGNTAALATLQSERVDSAVNFLAASDVHRLQAQGSLVGVGDGWQAAQLSSQLTHCVPDFYPRAYDLALLAEQELLAGNTQSPFSAELRYVRNQVHWKKHEKIRS